MPRLPTPRFAAADQFTRVVMFNARSGGETHQQQKARTGYQHTGIVQVAGKARPPRAYASGCALPNPFRRRAVP